MFAAILPGGANYLIILLLTLSGDFSDAGIFRLFLSVFGLFGLATFLESRKSFLTAAVAENRVAMLSIFAQRLKISAALFAVTILIYGANFVAKAFPFNPNILAVIGCAVLFFCFDYHLPVLQARKRFALLALLEILKYSAAIAVFFSVVLLNQTIGTATIGLLATIAIFHIGYFFAYVPKLAFPATNRNARRYSHTDPAARRARALSYANILPASLEHLDKILVGWIFGLEILGIYALAFSTGRLVFNILKPSLYIYYRSFVDKVPSGKQLISIGIGFTILGLLLSSLFQLLVLNTSLLQNFGSGAAATTILFLGYGIGMVRAVYSHALALHKHGNANRIFHASLLSSFASIILLIFALRMPPATAIILLALQYPLRDGLSVAFLSWRRGNSDA